MVTKTGISKESDEVLVFDHVIKDQILSLIKFEQYHCLSEPIPRTVGSCNRPSDSYSDGAMQISGIFEFQCADDDADCDGIPSSQDLAMITI